jgi:hypothetical protein
MFDYHSIHEAANNGEYFPDEHQKICVQFWIVNPSN